MKEVIENPSELVVNQYTVAFSYGDKKRKTVSPPAIAWFVETFYLIENDDTEEGIYTKPIIHSMN